MIYFVMVLTAISVGLLVYAAAVGIGTGEARVVKRQLALLRSGGSRALRELDERRRRQERRERFQDLLEAIGERVAGDGEQRGSLRTQMIQAGLRHPRAVVVYMGIRVLLAGGLALLGFAAGTVFSMGMTRTLLFTASGFAVGAILPPLYLARRIRHRQEAIQRGLPDALDLMVVCVEAGLGLNQTLVRIADEMERICPELSDELVLTNLEIRAGTSREEALRNLGERTGVEDVRALVGMLIQTDRFGTSIAGALRVHSEDLRSKRQQRAEEQAAKTTIKMIFPLVFFIFPATFVVILGPAMIQVISMFAGLG